MMSVIWLLVGFGLLIKGADLLVDGASVLARRLKASELAIGLTVVAFGTSLPELAVNVFASARNATDIAIGNIVGSNIANILLIIGISAVVCPLAIVTSMIRKEIPLMVMASAILVVLANDRFVDGAGVSVLSRTDGIVLLSFFVIFLCGVAGTAFDVSGARPDQPVSGVGMGKGLFLIAIGLTALIIGGNAVITGAVAFARGLGVSQALIGLTVVAVGTSLPELATSAVAAYKKNPDIAVGNVVGSNIFNIFFILGTSALINPLPFDRAMNPDIAVTAGAGLLLFLFMFTGKRKVVDKWEGALFLLLYAAYLTFVVLRG